MDEKSSRYDKYTSPKFHQAHKELNDFVSPEEIAKNEESENIPIVTPTTGKIIPTVQQEPNNNSSKNMKKSKKLIRQFKKHPKLFSLILILLIIILAGTYYLLVFKKNPVKPPKRIVKSNVQTPLKVVSNLVPSNLTGLLVNPSFNNLPVTGVMIENSDFARPQSGLGSAGVVFEALAEGGISRFLALFQDTQPSSIGPIRSARPYYVSWDLGFDAPYSHVGGSPEALTDITNWGVKDLNQFYNGSYYQRITSRAAPHNVYTSVATLNKLEASDGFGKSNFTSWPRKADSPLKIPTAKTINLTLSSSDYNVNYIYNPTANDYLRSEGGSPQIDANTNSQIAPKVVIAIVVPYALESDGYHLVYQTIGTGAAYIFQDGGVTIGQWSKANNNSQILFTDNSGKEIKLNSGQTWVTAVGDSNSISYSP